MNRASRLGRLERAATLASAGPGGCGRCGGLHAPAWLGVLDKGAPTVAYACRCGCCGEFLTALAAFGRGECLTVPA
jgi:hypothetical protein